MTRDQARPIAHAIVQLFLPGVNIDYAGHADFLLEKFELLGLLKFDEPKSANEKALEALRGKNLPRGPYNVFVLGPNEAGAIIDTLHSAGLKIIEKGQ